MFCFRPPADEVTNIFVTSLANDSKVITGYIKQVPNQPIVFAVNIPPLLVKRMTMFRR